MITKTKTRKWLFEYAGYIPSYRDIDASDMILEADTEEDARKMFFDRVQYVMGLSVKEILD